tara:strand:- start:273 stop:404 length:132 start_codon:yes stop_codon:yes gene_type:complete
MVMARGSMSKQLTGNRKKAVTKKGKQAAKQPKKIAKKTAKHRK